MSSTRVISATGVNSALHDGLWHLKTTGIMNVSRNGGVVQAPGPVITEYSRPDQRVMFSPLRDANPFFHLYESVWMLAGANDAASVANYAKQMAAFSDDGESLWGAYGWRWRKFFGFDQLTTLVRMLRSDPKTRRAVLTMWAPVGDLAPAPHPTAPNHWLGGPGAKDVPCNTQVYFDATKGALEMTVCNRSNDAVWGAYGANMVHMSMLQEFVARAAGLQLGTYYQLSNNFHLYCDRDDVKRLFAADQQDRAYWNVKYEPRDLYADGTVQALPIIGPGDHWEHWLGDAELMAENPTGEFFGLQPWFADVFQPLMAAHAEYKRGGDFSEAIRAANSCVASDWRVAAVEWLERRRAAQEAAR